MTYSHREVNKPQPPCTPSSGTNDCLTNPICAHPPLALCADFFAHTHVAWTKALRSVGVGPAESNPRDAGISSLCRQGWCRQAAGPAQGHAYHGRDEQEAASATASSTRQTFGVGRMIDQMKARAGKQQLPRRHQGAEEKSASPGTERLPSSEAVPPYYKNTTRFRGVPSRSQARSRRGVKKATSIRWH